MGSIIRPASFNGVFALKPSFGTLPRTGVLKTADTLDQIGLFTIHFEDLSYIFHSIRLRGKNYPFIHKFVIIEIILINQKLQFIILMIQFSDTESYVK